MVDSSDNGERIFRGIGVSPGVVRGRIVILDDDQGERPARHRVEPKNFPTELERLQEALAATRRDIARIQDEVRDRMGSSDAEIFDAHLPVSYTHLTLPTIYSV